MAISDEWEWFCGVNSTDIDTNGQVWTTDNATTKDDILGNSCLVDAIDTVAHVAFIVIGLGLILILAYCTRLKRAQTQHLIRFPGHGVRWLFLCGLVIILAGSVGEGILTDASYGDLQPSQPHLYLPQCCALIATLVCMTTYQYMEVWQAVHMQWLIVLYWICAFVTQILRLFSLEYQQVETLVEVDSLVEVARFDFTLAILVFYVLLIVVDLYAIIIKVSAVCSLP